MITSKNVPIIGYMSNNRTIMRHSRQNVVIIRHSQNSAVWSGEENVTYYTRTFVSMTAKVTLMVEQTLKPVSTAISLTSHI